MTAHEEMYTSCIPAEILLEHAVVEGIQVLAHNSVILQLYLVLLHCSLEKGQPLKSLQQTTLRYYL